MNDPPPQSKYEIDARDGKIGVIGDGTQVGEINIYEAPSGLGALLGRKGRIATLTPAQQRRNRENLLSNVKATWIDGYLHNAVHHAVFMELGLECKRDAVSRPWDLTLQPTNQAIPHDKSIGTVFREHGRSLLILGDPASGKTITMLQLAEALIAEAQQDETCPIPVILNLSSWAQKQPPLADWLVEEMFVAFQVSRPLTHAWLEANAFALLLDGLDEVDEACRDDCIAAINDFKAEHSLDIVVCSRIADYEKLSNRLNLSTAIRIQLLKPDQIDAYLYEFGPRLDGLRAALTEDEELRELAESPLMLSLMPLVYWGLDQQQIPTSATLDRTRRDFLATYVRRVFQHRPLPKDSTYDESQSLRWLTNLARGMAERSESIFYIERLEPSWLPTDLDWRRYHRLVGQVAGLVVWLSIMLAIAPLSWQSDRLARLVVGGLICGLILVLLGGWSGMPTRQQGSKLDSHITLHEELRWSPPSANATMSQRLRALLVGGLVGGLTMGLVATLLSGQRFVLAIGLRTGLMWVLAVWLFYGLAFGVGISVQSSQTRSRLYPNQGIRSTFRNALRMGLLTVLILGLPFGLFFMQSFDAVIRPNSTMDVSRLPVGLIIVMGGWLSGLAPYGGIAVLQHYTLRLLLARRRVLPFPFRDSRLVAYLDAMADRILLRRVGGGWMFIHRYLLEYFASQHPDCEAHEES